MKRLGSLRPLLASQRTEKPRRIARCHLALPSSLDRDHDHHPNYNHHQNHRGLHDLPRGSGRESGGNVALGGDVRRAGISTAPVLHGQLAVFPTAMATTSIPREYSLSMLAFLLLKRREESGGDDQVKSHHRRVICSNLRHRNLTTMEEAALVKTAIENIDEWTTDYHYSSILQEIMRSGKPESRTKLINSMLEATPEIFWNKQGGKVLRAIARHAGDTPEFRAVLRRNFTHWSRTYSGVLIMKEIFDQPFEEEHKFLAGLVLNEISQIAPNRFGKWLMVSALERVDLPEKAMLLTALIPLMEYCCSLPQGSSYAGIVTGEIGAFYRDANEEQRSELTQAIVAEMGAGKAGWLLEHPDAIPAEEVLGAVVKSQLLWQEPAALNPIFVKVFKRLPAELRETLLENVVDKCKQWACSEDGNKTLIRYFENASEEEVMKVIDVLAGHEKEILQDEHGRKVALFLIRRASKEASAGFVKLLLEDFEHWIGEGDRLEQVKFAIRLADDEQAAALLRHVSGNVYKACVDPSLQPVLQEVQKLCRGEALEELNRAILAEADALKNHPVGFKIILQVLHRGTHEMKVALLEQFMPSLRELSTQKHGFEVCKLCVAVAFELDSQGARKRSPSSYFARVREQLEPIEELSQNQYGFVVARFMLNHIEKPTQGKPNSRAQRKAAAASVAVPGA